MRKLFVAAAMAASLVALPAMAQDQAPPAQNDRVNAGFRSTLGAIYGAAGARACGTPCAQAAKKAGTAVYDGAQKASVTGAAKIQEFGRNLRQKRGK